MNPVVLAIGKVLRLVGISSPEDALPKARSTNDPPSWRERAQGETAQGNPAQGKPDEPAS
jgi:hypothetical protein